MNNVQECKLLRSIARAYAGKRNVGNMKPEELEQAGQLTKENLITTSTYKNSEWCELTDAGIKRLYYLNALSLGV